MVENLIIDQCSTPTPDDLPEQHKDILHDFWICCVSREASLLARKEVLTGKAKFGITGDGKEVPQVAMARAFKKGDFHAGYYREQTFMLALDLMTVEEYFAQLYADSDNDPFSGGRQMNNHFATKMIDEEGNFLPLKDLYNVTSGISSTAGHIARAVGLALASKQYRNTPSIRNNTSFSNNGNEVCFATIGDASTSEGVFWESMNAAGVMQIPLAISVWDDGYGISVPKKYQTTKESISAALAGLGKEDDDDTGIDIYVLKAYDYPGLVAAYKEGIEKIRATHTPALFHVEDCTQPQGHSTSGSHERYKSKTRLAWERNHDCLVVMADWMKKEGIATAEDIEKIQKKARKHVRECKNRAWKAVADKNKALKNTISSIYNTIEHKAPQVTAVKKDFKNLINPSSSELIQNARQMYYLANALQLPETEDLKNIVEAAQAKAKEDYCTHLYSNTDNAATKIPVVQPSFSHESLFKNGYEILNSFFKKALEQYPNLFAFGEDVGNIGDVNQGFARLQKLYGEDRVFDTGIREWTIMGQALGMSMRGLRPIAEIQYLDYIVYGLQPLHDDAATLRYRSDNIQQAPMIVRTRGHRLEGIWHTGSPMGMLVNSLRGMYICVPRNMTQAAGMYNTLLQSNDPAIVIECLNAYRLKERMPDNIGKYTVPLGMIDQLQSGKDITLVTYGSCVRVAQKAIELLSIHGISVELIDVQTLIPFDLEHGILQSLKKTGRIVFLDEDVPGGATAYMMQQVLEVQGGYYYLDSAPKTITAQDHRTPYGSDGDYYTKPNPETVFELIYNLIRETNPDRLLPL